MKAWIKTANEILAEISRFGLLAALVALAVGAVGIFNVMAASVIERTQEIGLRKAVGARRMDILAQFLAESAAIGFVGGIAGVLLALIVTIVVSISSGYSVYLQWLPALLAICAAVASGMAAGYFPAKRAADMRPMEALRYE